MGQDDQRATELSDEGLDKVAGGSISIFQTQPPPPPISGGTSSGGTSGGGGGGIGQAPREPGPDKGSQIKFPRPA